MTSLAALCVALSLLTLSACGPTEELREWKPSDHQPPPAGADPDRAAPTEAGDALAQSAAALWTARCASCHGRNGLGDGPERPPGVAMPVMIDPAWQAARSDEQLAQVIREGRGMMPAFGKELSEPGLTALVAQVRRLARQ